MDRWYCPSAHTSFCFYYSVIFLHRYFTPSPLSSNLQYLLPKSYSLLLDERAFYLSEKVEKLISPTTSHQVSDHLTDYLYLSFPYGSHYYRSPEIWLIQIEVYNLCKIHGILEMNAGFLLIVVLYSLCFNILHKRD